VLVTSETDSWRNRLAFSQDTIGVFGTQCISAAHVQTTRQGFPTEVHPLVCSEHIVQKQLKQSISKQLTPLFFFFFIFTSLVWVLPGTGKFVFLFFFLNPLSSKSGSCITYGY